MLSPLQLNTSAHRPTRSARGSVPVRFGKLSQEEQEKTLRPYEPVIGGLPDFQNPKKKLGQPNFVKTYENLCPRAQDQFAKLTKEVSDSEIDWMRANKKMGFIEEAGDILFQAVESQAAHKGLINEKKADSVKTLLPEKTKEAREGKSFERFLQEVNQKLPADQLKSLTQTINWDSEKTKELVTLDATKFGLMRSRNSAYQIKKESDEQFKGEIKELDEIMPRFSPRRIQLWADGFAFRHFSSLPIKYLGSQLQGIVSSFLKVPVKYGDLMENVYHKQKRRQEFDYYNPQYRANEERKFWVKGVEAVQEGSILAKVYRRAGFWPTKFN